MTTKNRKKLQYLLVSSCVGDTVHAWSPVVWQSNSMKWCCSYVSLQVGEGRVSESVTCRRSASTWSLLPLEQEILGHWLFVVWASPLPLVIEAKTVVKPALSLILGMKCSNCSAYDLSLGSKDGQSELCNMPDFWLHAHQGFKLKNNANVHLIFGGITYYFLN